MGPAGRRSVWPHARVLSFVVRSYPCFDLALCVTQVVRTWCDRDDDGDNDDEDKFVPSRLQSLQCDRKVNGAFF